MEIVDVTYLGSNDQYQEYAPADLSLVNKAFIAPLFGGPTDYVELFVKDQAGTVIGSNYNLTKYNIGSDINPETGTTNVVYLDPETDARDLGFNRGSVNIKYNFFRRFINSSPSPSQNFWIKEISRSRTEIKCARQDMSNLELAAAFNEFNGVLGNDAYYPDFLLDFGRDVQIIGINAVYTEEAGQGYVIFKLYEPLPTNYDIKSTFWVVTQIAEPADFNVTINVAPEVLATSTSLRGPNYKVNITDRIGKTTPYYNYASLFSTAVTSSYQQLQSLMDEKGIQINVDYSSFENFIHYSSATERLHNFVYKLQTIESASAALVSPNTSTAKITLQSDIDNIIQKFDGYEYYLYFTSASTAWPKSSTTQPYPLYSLTSSQASSWLGSINTTPTATTMSMYYSASVYDNGNKDWLQYTTPAYIREDLNNAPYLVFLDMIGQHFDNIWIYLKDLGNRYSAENNPFVGISMDQVGDALKSFGINLYTNTNVSDNIYYSLLGINQTGSPYPVTSSNYSTIVYASSSLYPKAGDPYLSSSLLLPPFGNELIAQYVTTFVTASQGITSSFETLPAEQLKNEVYKRLYHNLAYLLKTKGTERGVKALITTYGIPEDILTVNEYGGYNIYDIAGIQEINNDNVITGSVLTISSSLLSPYTTLQYYQNDFDKTSPDIEVGFSPTDAINAAITSSGLVTASNDPGYFNIMQYIGNPILQYTPTYAPLVTLENTFFNATMTGNSETNLQRFNVWDFIRSIKYYNNSLFKMIKDFVPARANLSTGIIVRSHILERNKYARHQPTVTFEDQAGEIEMISIEGSDGQGILYDTSYTASIPIQYSSASNYLSNALGYVTMVSNTGVENYNGEFSGSTIFASYNEFPQVGVSSYTYPWTSSVAPSEHGGNNIMFTTYSLNYLTGNITGSVISQRFLDLDYSSNQIVPLNYGLITQSLSQSLIIGPVSQSQQPYSQYAQLQDYNYSLRRSIQPRYSGSYLSGLNYNVYTSQNITYSGDISYGNDPVINYYTTKLGLFTQLATSSFIPGVVNASLAYFADVSGGLSELNQNNKNWQDIQNTFVAGDNLTIKQFDNKKYSNQVASDGVKLIYNSGYNYTPQLYFSTASDTKLYFQYAGNAVVGNFYATNQTSLYVSGSTASPFLAGTRYYASASRGYIYNIFDSEISDTNSYFTTGNPTYPGGLFPTFSAPYAGVRSFDVELSVDVAFPTTNQQITYSLSLTKNGTPLSNGSVTAGFKSTQTAGTSRNGTATIVAIRAINTGVVLTSGVITGPINLFNQYGSLIGTSGTNTWISASTFNYSYYDYSGGGGLVTSYGYFATNYSPDPVLNTIQTWQPGGNSTQLTNLSSATTTPAVNQLTKTLTLNLATTPTSFGPGDQVLVQLLQTVTASNYSSSFSNYTASLSQGSFTMTEITSQGTYAYATASSGQFISSSINVGNLGEIVFSNELSSYYGYSFVPYFKSGSTTYSSSLYNQYGDINTTFDPKQYDKLILQDVNGVTQDLNIYTASLSGSQLVVYTVPTISPNWVGSASLIENFLLLRRYNDEQNVILTFNKPVGQTSYGFLLSETVSPEVTANINTLQAAVQSQLLSTQTGTANQ